MPRNMIPVSRIVLEWRAYLSNEPSISVVCSNCSSVQGCQWSLCLELRRSNRVFGGVVIAHLSSVARILLARAYSISVPITVPV